MKIRMLLGRPAEQIFPYIPFEKCIREQTQVLERLIRINAANINMTVVPVMRGGRCIGAFSTLQPLSELEKSKMSCEVSCEPRDIGRSIILRM